MKRILLLITLFLPCLASQTEQAPHIETERLILRQWQDQDTDALWHMLEKPEVNKYLEIHGKYTPESVAGFVTRARTNIANKGYGYFACQHKETGELMGYAGLNYVDFVQGSPFPCYTVSWIFSDDFWGKGYATEAGSALLKLGFEQHKIPTIYSCAVAENQKSEEVMKRVGMQHIGMFDFPGKETHPHAKHVLYMLTKEAYEKNKAH